MKKQTTQILILVAIFGANVQAMEESANPKSANDYPQPVRLISLSEHSFPTTPGTCTQTDAQSTKMKLAYGATGLASLALSAAVSQVLAPVALTIADRFFPVTRTVVRDSLGNPRIVLGRNRIPHGLTLITIPLAGSFLTGALFSRFITKRLDAYPPAGIPADATLKTVTTSRGKQVTVYACSEKQPDAP